MAPFKRHINHASSCFGWQPFFLGIFPIAHIRHLWQERHLKAGEFQIGKVYIDIDVFGELSNSSNLNNAFQYIPILLIANNNKT